MARQPGQQGTRQRRQGMVDNSGPRFVIRQQMRGRSRSPADQITGVDAWICR
jgi:hypothetical protein